MCFNVVCAEWAISPPVHHLHSVPLGGGVKAWYTATSPSEWTCVKPQPGSATACSYWNGLLSVWQVHCTHRNTVRMAARQGHVGSTFHTIRTHGNTVKTEAKKNHIGSTWHAVYTYGKTARTVPSVYHKYLSIKLALNIPWFRCLTVQGKTLKAISYCQMLSAYRPSNNKGM